MTRIAKLLIAAFCVASMAGCSSGPSDAEVESAIKARVTDATDGEHAIKVISAKNLRCRSEKAKDTYMCDVEVEMDMPMPMGGSMHSVAQLRMIKTNGAWSYDRNQPLSMEGSRE